MLLNNEGINNKIKDKIKNYLKTSANENKTTPNLCEIAKVVLRQTLKQYRLT